MKWNLNPLKSSKVTLFTKHSYPSLSDTSLAKDLSKNPKTILPFFFFDFATFDSMKVYKNSVHVPDPSSLAHSKA